MTEAELIKASRRGSLDALTELIGCHTPYISSVIARIPGGRGRPAGRSWRRLWC